MQQQQKRDCRRTHCKKKKKTKNVKWEREEKMKKHDCILKP